MNEHWMRTRPGLSARATLAALGLMVLFLPGCATNNAHVAKSDFTTLPARSGILLMPPDIKFYLVTASGITEPNAEWTEASRTSFLSAFQQFAEAHELEVRYEPRDDTSDLASRYDLLHSVVGTTILSSHYGPAKLPAKAGAFDWSLGPGVSALSRDPNERYVLFVHYRDYEATGGRMGMAIFAAALGVAIPTGQQIGFASLVDLRTGNLVWFNFVPGAMGDVRTAEGAGRIVQQLLADLVQ